MFLLRPRRVIREGSRLRTEPKEKQVKISILTIFDARRERDGRIEKKSMKAVPQMKQKKQREEMGGGKKTKKKPT